VTRDLSLYSLIRRTGTHVLQRDLIDGLSFTAVHLPQKSFTHMETSPLSVKGALQNFGLCTARRAFEQGGIFIVPHLLWHWASNFPVSSKGPPHLSASYDTQGIPRIYSNLDTLRSPFSRLLRHAWGWWRPILTWILTGCWIQTRDAALINTPCEWLITYFESFVKIVEVVNKMI
jgi:hypothetical protein